ncbi:MAG: family 10 glycosylhydrolase [bacterium]
MKKAFIIFLVLLSFPLLSKELELRGIWMQATQIKDERSAEQIAERIASAKLNAVFVLVFYWGGKSYFKTDLSPLVYNSQNADLFAYFIEQCHRRGIKVYARFSIGKEGGQGDDGILIKNPDWQMENQAGERIRWFDLGKKDVREFQLKLISDLLERYPIDGIQLDYIRYPSRDYCYCRECRENFKRLYGFDPLYTSCKLPRKFKISTTPLLHPTSSTALATFDNGIPAITLRQFNSGTLLYFNFTINYSSAPLFLYSLGQALTTKKEILIIAPGKELGYEEESYGFVISLLRKVGLQWRMIRDIAQIDPKESLIILPGLIRVSDDLGDKLKQFLFLGGSLFVSAGRKGIEESKVSETLIGVKDKGRYMVGNYLIIPKTENPLLLFSEDVESKWVEYRKEIITSLVKEFYETTKRKNPSLLLSAAVFYDKARAEKVLQDWYKWLELGIVDFVAPMAYVDDNRLISALREWKSYDSNLEKIIPGLRIYEIKNGKEVARDLKQVMRQIEIIKKEGAKGFILFSLPFLTDDLCQYLATLGLVA